MLTEVMIEDERWQGAGLADLAEMAAQATLDHLGMIGAHEVSILGCDDARIATLNADFRGKPQPTNVLSWPGAERGAERGAEMAGAKPAPVTDEELGDIAIAYETCAAEAEAAGKSLRDHGTHLIVHAMLHLLGYDHIHDLDANLMERTEIEILGKMGLADPY